MEHHRSINIYRQIALTFAGISIALIFLILYFSLSSAKIVIVPKVDEIKVEYMETVGGADTGQSVGGRIVQTEISGDKSFESSRSGTGQPAIATGIIKVINESSNDQPLIVKTRFLSSDGVLFRLKKRILVPAGGSVDAEVYADESGESGNIDPSDFTIPGLGEAFEGVIYGESEEAMTGGLLYVYEVSEEDIENAKKEFLAELKERSLRMIESQQRVGESLLKEASHAIVLKEEVNASVGDAVPKFNLSLKIQVQGLFSNESKILDLAKQELYKKSGKDLEIISIDEENFVFQLEKYDQVEKTAQIKVSLVGKGMLRKTSSILDKNILRGMKKREVIDYLKGQPGVEDVKVELSPFWVRSIPKLKDHIEIQIQK